MARISHSRSRRQPNYTLQALRFNAGLSRVQLEARTGVSRESIRLAELGCIPGPGIQFALADFFNQRPTDIWPLKPTPTLAVAA